MASTAWARVMAGPWVKSAVPAAMRQLRTPGTGSPAMPISTGTTSQWAVRAIWHTLVRRIARFSATARVTSARSGSRPAPRRRCPRRAPAPPGGKIKLRTAGEGGGILQQSFQPPSPPRGFASLAQWAWAAARAASFGRVMPAKSVQFRFGHVCFSFVVDRTLHRSQSGGAGECPAQ